MPTGYWSGGRFLMGWRRRMGVWPTGGLRSPPQQFLRHGVYSPINCILVPFVDVCHGTHDVIGHCGDMIACVILVHTMIHMWWMVCDVLEWAMGHVRVVHGGWGIAHVGCVNAIIILYKSGNKYAITNTDHTYKFQNNLIYTINYSATILRPVINL